MDIATKTKDGLTPFLNIEKDAIVYLPAKNTWVRRLLNSHPKIDMFGIRHDDYKQLIAMNILPKVVTTDGVSQTDYYMSALKADTRAYFINHGIINAVDSHKLSRQAFGAMYDALTGEGNCFSDLLLGFGSTIKYWHEEAIESYAKKENINSDNEECMINAVQKHIDANWRLTYRKTYKVDDRQMVLYNEI